MRRTLAELALSIVVTAVSAPSLARAQEPPGPTAPADRAVELGHEGIRLFNQGAWLEAHGRFEEAERIAHSPVLVLYMARSQRQAGRLLAAEQLFQRVAAEAIPPDAPAPWHDARTSAASELRALAARIPRLVLALRGAPPDEITIDGEPVASASWSSPLPLDPGEHVVRAARAGAPPFERRVELVEGRPPERVEVAFAAAFDRAAAPPPDRATPPPSGGGSFVPAAVAFGAGAAGVAVGIGAGAAARSKADDVLSRCVGDRCQAADEEAAGSAETLASASTVAFVIAGVAVAGGVVLLVVRPGGGGPASPAVSVRVGPASLGARLAF